VFNATLAENIRYAGLGGHDEVSAAADAAGLGTLLARSPRGLDTSAGERGRALSAGERQRLALARAFLADPAVLVLDEATGALDPATEAQVAAGYEAVMAGRTTIIITHSLDLARRADRVLVLERGRIVEREPPPFCSGSGSRSPTSFRRAHWRKRTTRAVHARGHPTSVAPAAA
jgi:ABC-type multidrug transport system fused ATPase/permease subunit